MAGYPFSTDETVWAQEGTEYWAVIVRKNPVLETVVDSVTCTAQLVQRSDWLDWLAVQDKEACIVGTLVRDLLDLELEHLCEDRRMI